MSERLQAVLARCERIQRGAENFENLPQPLAERLKVLYSKCERLKHEKLQNTPLEDPQEHGHAAEGLDGAHRDDVAMTDPYLDHESLDFPEATVPEEENLQELLTCNHGVASPSPASPTQASDVTDEPLFMLDVSQDETLQIQKDEEPKSGPSVCTQMNFVAWNDLPPGCEFLAQEVPYVIERRVGQSHGSAIYALRSSTGAGFIVKMSAQSERASARLLPGDGELQRVQLEHVTLDIFEAAAFIQTLTQVITDFATIPPSAQTESQTPPPMPATPQPEQSTFKLPLLMSETGTDSTAAKEEPVDAAVSQNSLLKEAADVPVDPPESAPDPKVEASQSALAPAFPKMPPVMAAAPSKPQEPLQSLSTMLGSYAEEEESPQPKPEGEIEIQENPVLPQFSLPKAQTAFGAKIRAAARMAKAALFSEKAPEEAVEDAPMAAADPMPMTVKGKEGAVQTWDPATGQFVTEEIPMEIAEEFKRKPDLNLEDYQERVLLAQLQDKKRRLQQQQEERERQRRKIEREEAARQKAEEEKERKEQEQRAISAVLESYAQELGDRNSAPKSEACEASSRFDTEPPAAPAAPVAPAPAAAPAALVAAQAQFLLQAQLTAMHPVRPQVGVDAAHLHLAAQIYAWMAGAQGRPFG